MWFGRIVVGTAALGVYLAAIEGTCQDKTAPRIELEEFRIEPTTLRLGESFVITARAAAEGVKLGSFLLRTADDVRKEQEIPGFPL